MQKSCFAWSLVFAVIVLVTLHESSAGSSHSSKCPRPNMRRIPKACLRPRVRVLLSEFLCPADPCKDVDCGTNGICDAGTCVCDNGFSGDNCETADPCNDVDCGTNGSCAAGTCVCDNGFSGDNCEIDACSDVDCGANGTCDAGTCVCDGGYMGERCEIRECIPACATGETCQDSGICVCEKHCPRTCIYRRTVGRRFGGGMVAIGITSVSDCEDVCTLDITCIAGYLNAPVCYRTDSDHFLTDGPATLTYFEKMSCVRDCTC